jgi:hypothetical protein
METRVPALTDIELADEIEQACGRGVEVRGELGDLVAELIQRARVHGVSPSVAATLYPQFRSAWKA